MPGSSCPRTPRSGRAACRSSPSCRRRRSSSATCRSVTNIRYFAPADVAQRLTSESFRATADLSQANPQPGNPFVTVPVVVTADPRVTILDYDPPSITVQLDPLCPRRCRSRSTTATSPGPRDPRPGPVGDRGDRFRARVGRPPGDRRPGERRHPAVGDRRRPDGRPRRRRRPGRGPGPGQHRAEQVRVKISVGSGLQSKTLPVNPIVTGTPADRLPGRVGHGLSTGRPRPGRRRRPRRPRRGRHATRSRSAGRRPISAGRCRSTCPTGSTPCPAARSRVTITFQPVAATPDVHGRDRPVGCPRRSDVHALDGLGPGHGRRDRRGPRRARSTLAGGHRRRRRARAGDAQGQAQGLAPGRRQARRARARPRSP